MSMWSPFFCLQLKWVAPLLYNFRQIVTSIPFSERQCPQNGW